VPVSFACQYCYLKPAVEFSWVSASQRYCHLSAGVILWCDNAFCTLLFFFSLTISLPRLTATAIYFLDRAFCWEMPRTLFQASASRQAISITGFGCRGIHDDFVEFMTAGVLRNTTNRNEPCSNMFAFFFSACRMILFFDACGSCRRIMLSWLPLWPGQRSCACTTEVKFYPGDTSVARTVRFFSFFSCDLRARGALR
jgi:hypothetical protein